MERNSDFCRRKLPRMFIIMKTWFVLLFVCTMHLSASNLYSQQKKNGYFHEKCFSRGRVPLYPAK